MPLKNIQQQLKLHVKTFKVGGRFKMKITSCQQYFNKVILKIKINFKIQVITINKENFKFKNFTQMLYLFE